METSLAHLLAELMAMQLVLRTERLLEQLMEKHLEQQRDLSLVQLTGLLKELRLVCLLVDLMVM